MFVFRGFMQHFFRYPYSQFPFIDMSKNFTHKACLKNKTLNSIHNQLSHITFTCKLAFTPPCTHCPRQFPDGPHKEVISLRAQVHEDTVPGTQVSVMSGMHTGDNLQR